MTTIAEATTYTVTPVADPVANYNTLQQKIDQLQAGDVLELDGDSSLPFEISQGLVISGCQSAVHVTNCASNQKKVQGTSTAPITIRAATGKNPVIVYKGSSNNIIDIRSSQYLVIDGLEITQTAGGEKSGIDGIKIYDSEHVTISNNHIHHLGGVIINFKSQLASNGVNAYHRVYHNHLHHASINTAEGLYIGCSNPSVCYAHNIEVDQNWIHDTSGTQGDGIEVKERSYAITITDNVIYNTRYPGITMYGFAAGQCISPSQRSRVERNVIFNGLNSGIEIDGPGIVHNNIIFGNALHGIQSRKNPDCLQDLEITNNTLVDNGGNNLDLRDWGGKSGMVLAFNASYILGLAGPAGGQAFFSQSMSGVQVVGNVFFGAVTNPSAIPFTPGGIADFNNAAAWDFWPVTGTLIDGVPSGFVPTNDFNETSRDSFPDVGAYEALTSTNQGWMVQKSFKGETPSLGSGGADDDDDSSTNNSVSSGGSAVGGGGGGTSSGCGVLRGGYRDAYGALALFMLTWMTVWVLRQTRID